jgi:hypothetical protein
MAEEPSQEDESEKVHEGKMAAHEFYDTHVLSFPMRDKKPTTEEQFNRFMEMIQQSEHQCAIDGCDEGPNLRSLPQGHTQHQAATADH